MSTSRKSPEPAALGIGALAHATGVPVETLRTWERRYGFPEPVNRTGGSHRRYASETIPRVRLIVRALELGHRAASVVPAHPDELRRLLGVAVPERGVNDPVAGAAGALDPAELDARHPSAGADRRIIARWLEHTRNMDGDGLLGGFQRELAEMSVLEFLARRMGPYLSAMGDAWAQGELRISQEHFASERVREFLNAEWRALSGATRGARAAVVFATPPGEEHALGLHMAAWVVALAGAPIVFLGTSTPMAELAFAVERYRARGAVLSVAAGYAGDLRGQLAELAVLLPAGVAVAAGGAGSVSLGEEPVLNSFAELFEWARALSPASPTQPRR